MRRLEANMSIVSCLILCLNAGENLERHKPAIYPCQLGVEFMETHLEVRVAGVSSRGRMRGGRTPNSKTSGSNKIGQRYQFLLSTKERDARREGGWACG